LVNRDGPGEANGEESGLSFAEKRDAAGGQRDAAAEKRDAAGGQRDAAGGVRDAAAEKRDRAGDQRDAAAEERDRAGDQQDAAAEERIGAAEQSEELALAEVATDALDRSALARRDAAVDRSRASLDRGAGANERIHSELDRNTALADRGASARERRYAAADGLTGVYLRGPGFTELEREIARARRTGQPLTLAFVDVDGLKAVNDSSGHAAGDRLLIEVANAFGAALRSYDLVIRYGGDEFVCAMPGLNVAEATKRFTLVTAALAEAPEHGSVTVGLVELHADDSLEDLIARADSALYRARQ
jgi:diguanylate cyclase (GGDEF)-like protein